MSEEFKDKVCLFAGTTEGRLLAGFLKDAVRLTACVATEYGEIMLDGLEGITVHSGRMDQAAMEGFFRSEGFDRIIDATHPFAQVVSENIASAAKSCGLSVMRILREVDQHFEEAVYFDSIGKASAFLANQEGNILITTGSKELSSYSNLDMSRVWARVLPCVSSLELCEKAGIPAQHIIAEQGPFSYEVNLAQLHMTGARYLVTKESGRNGGFEEKIKAALDAGAVPVIIGQPPQGNGYCLDAAMGVLDQCYSISKQRLYLIGIGPGSRGMLTEEASSIIHGCDAVIGAKNVTALLSINKSVYDAFLPEKVRKVLQEHPSIRSAAIVMRGDVGFYSGAKRMIDEFGKENLTIVPGISSPIALAARLGVCWEDAAMVSMHGRDCNLIHTVCSNGKTFVLTGGENTVGEICKKLCSYGLESLSVKVGEKLSYPDERLTSGKASEFAGADFDSLSVMLIENENPVRRIRHGIPDDEFIRGDVPMTKAEVRSISLSSLALRSDSIVWDIGAGTGSVSIECALAAYDGTVFAIEKEEDAVELIGKNKIRFRTDNLVIVKGTAPEALSDLPTPTHVFIGGSSGNLEEILALLLERNPNVRVVINTVTLETQTEVLECARKFGFETMDMTTVNISRSRKMGRYHMMSAQNPVTVFVLQGARPRE